MNATGTGRGAAGIGPAGIREDAAPTDERIRKMGTAERRRIQRQQSMSATEGMPTAINANSWRRRGRVVADTRQRLAEAEGRPKSTIRTPGVEHRTGCASGVLTWRRAMRRRR
jgi:hypothetical protein